MKNLMLLVVLVMMFFTSSVYSQDDFTPIEVKVVSKPNVMRTVDEFTGKVKINSSYGENVTVLKYVEGKTTTTYLSLNTTGSTCVVDGTGVIVLFKDGTKWVKNGEEIDCDVNTGSGSSFKYSAFITLTPADIKLFSAKKVKKFKLYIFEGSVRNPEKFNAEFVEAISMK